MEANVWEAVRGGSDGGIPVQVARSGLSEHLGERLGVGAYVREHELHGDRLFFEKLAGEGPAWGWATVRKGGEELLRLRAGSRRAAPAAGGAAGPALEVHAANPETGFSYEGLPSWVPRAAAVARLRRRGLAYLPPAEEAPRGRPEGLALARWRELSAEELTELSQQDLPGCVFGLAFPHSAGQIASGEFGAEWLTKAFQAAGTLAQGNRVTRVVRCDELPTSGVDTPGAGAMKAFLTVEYLKADPELHTELFVKYPYECGQDSPLPFVRYNLSRAADDHDGKEIAVNLALPHLFPFRTPKVYFGDICRETTNWILIQERIPYAKSRKAGAGRGSAEAECKPFEVLPVCNKYQDFLLPDPAEYYCSLFSKMGQLAAWDKLGRFHCFFSHSPTHTQEQFLSMLHREPQPMLKCLEIHFHIGSSLDKAIDFVLDCAMHLVPPDVCDKPRLEKMKEEIMAMALFLGDFTTCYQFNDSDYIALMHPGCTTDNAFFWRDEYGELDCGLFDWGAFHRHPFCMWFDRCLNIVDPDMLKEKEEAILQSFIDDYHRCGGPKLPLEEVVLRFRMAYVQALLEDIGKLDLVLWETSREELRSITDVADERFQGRYKTRVFSMMVLSKIAYYVTRDDFKALFDKWCEGAGKPYLTPYV